MIVEHRDFFDNHWMKMMLRTFDNSIDSIVITTSSDDKNFLYVNESFKKQTGYCEEELFEKSPRVLQGKKTNRNVIEELKEKLLKDEYFIGQNTNYRKDGTTYIVQWSISSLKNEQNETIAYISYQKEITQYIWEHNQVHLLSSIIDQVDQVVLVTDLVGIIVYVNKAFVSKYGFREDEVLHKNVRFLKSGKQSKSFYKDVWNTIQSDQSYHGVFINKDKKGELFFEQKTISPLKNEKGDVNFYVSIAQDITDLVNESDEYKDKAYKDSLTGLYNRLKLEEILQRKFKEYNQREKKFSIIMIDIDNFKSINDVYGHDKGDDVLRDLAIILKGELRQNDLTIRWGGEEFMVLIDNGLESSLAIAEKLRLAVENKLHIDTRNITISIGISEIQKGDSQEILFKRADRALYNSKHNGKNMVSTL